MQFSEPREKVLRLASCDARKFGDSLMGGYQNKRNISMIFFFFLLSFFWNFFGWIWVCSCIRVILLNDQAWGMTGERGEDVCPRRKTKYFNFFKKLLLLFFWNFFGRTWVYSCIRAILLDDQAWSSIGEREGGLLSTTKDIQSIVVDRKRLKDTTMDKKFCPLPKTKFWIFISGGWSFFFFEKVDRLVNWDIHESTLGAIFKI